MKEIKHPYSQKAKVSKLTEHSAFLSLPDGQTLEWDKSMLPPDISVDMEIKLIIHDSKKDIQERQQLAKEILNELFSEETR